MSNSSIEKDQPQTTGIDHLPAVPAVTFHRDLGKQYQEIDFDYPTFNSLAEALKLEPDTLRDLQIEVTTPGELRGAGGTFDPHTNTIQVSARKEGMNKSLVHEMRHAIDNQNGELEIGPRIVAGNTGVIFTPVGASLSLVGLVSSELGVKAAEGLRDASCWMTLAFGAAAIFGYYLHPLEVKARRAAREHDVDIITYTKRRQ